MIALARTPGTHQPIQRDFPSKQSSEELKENVVITSSDQSELWSENALGIDFAQYSRCVMEKTKNDQAKACVSILSMAADHLSHKQDSPERSMFKDQFKMTYLGLMYACMIAVTKEKALVLLKQLAFQSGTAFQESLTQFLGQSAAAATAVGLNLLNLIAQAKSAESEQLQDEILSGLCASCSSSSFGNRIGQQEAICSLLKDMRHDRTQKHEAEIINTALVCIKSVPKELSLESMAAIRFFVNACMRSVSYCVSSLAEILHFTHDCLLLLIFAQAVWSTFLYRKI